MADKDQQNEDYEYADLESPENEFKDEIEPEPAKQSVSPDSNVVRRNALIVVGLVLGLFFIYKFIAPYFTGSKEAVAPTMPPVVQTTPTPAPVPEVVQQPVAPVIQEADEQLKKNVSTIEIGQQGMRSDIASLNSQVSGLNNKLDALTNQINSLNQALNALSNQVAQQSSEMNALMVKAEPKKPAPRARMRPAAPQITYHIQAVIPGRAWLIGSNGSILTVREGIRIRGYGVVQLIDPLQGRVLTSSGKVIRFSPEDS